MGRHLWNFLGTAWKLVTDSLSTSTLSIVVFSIGVPFVVFGIVTLYKWSKTERTRASFAKVIRDEVKLVAILSIAVEVFAWVFLFSWGVYVSGYNDHQNLSGRLQAVVNEKNELKMGLGVRDSYIQHLTAQNARLITTLEATNKNSARRPTIVNAPGGIPIIGNKGTVQSPTVNNYGPIPRRLTDNTKKELKDCLRKNVGRFYIGAINGNSEAYKYAQDWREVFIDAGWDVEHKDISIQQFLIGGESWAGLRFRIHDVSTVEGKWVAADGSPEKGLTECMIGRSDISGGGLVIFDKSYPTGSVQISVSYLP